MNVLDVTLDQYLVFAMTLIRMGGLVVFMPFFGSEFFPVRARIAVAVFLSLVVLPHAARTVPAEFRMDLFELGWLACREAAIGLILGQAATFLFAGLQLGGEMIGQQIGFSLANVVDPMYDTQIGLISFFQFLVALALFVALDMHLLVAQVLALSYEVVGIGGGTFEPGLAGKLSHMFGKIWVTALRTGGPILLIMMMINTIQGFVSRTMPQFNIIAVGLPLQTTVGLMALVLGLRPFCNAVAALGHELVIELDTLVDLMAQV